MKNILLCVPLVLAIDACSAPVPAQAPMNPIIINRADVIKSGTLTIGAIEDGLSAYLSRHNIDPTTLTKLQRADMVARVALGDLTRAESAAFPAQAKMAAVSLKALVAILPPGLVPAPIEAGLIAFAELAQIIAQTAPQPAAQPPAAVPAPAGPATAPEAPQAAPTPAPETHYQVHPGAPPSIIQ